MEDSGYYLMNMENNSSACR